MFTDNQHTHEYYGIIFDAISRLPINATRKQAKTTIGYVESHHIIPESIGGSNDSDNKVWLTAHEHIRCHILLTEMCKNEGHRHKMLLAATRMINKQDNRREREKIIFSQLTDEEIQWLANIRVESALAHSKYMSDRVKGEKNAFYGKKHTAESNAKRGLWDNKNNPMYDSKIVAGLSGDNHYSKKEEHLGKHSGDKNGRYDPTVYSWENIHTGETKSATRLEMTRMNPGLKSNISQVIKGNTRHVKGWRVVED